MWKICIVLLILTITERTNCVNWLDVKNDYEVLVSQYATNIDKTTDIKLTNILPVTQDQSLTINIGLDIFSVSSFDAVAGRLDILGSVKLRWQDDISTQGSFVSGVQSLMVDYSNIWTPTLILLNSANSVSTIGDSAYKVRFFTANGTVMWSPRAIMAAACTPDVSFFPFDQQECGFILTSWSRNEDEIVFKLMSNEWGMYNFDPSNVWEVIETSSALVTVGNRNAAKFSIVIKRYSLYFAFNIVLPILLLAALSGFLFLLPVDSGERVGFAITCFLSFAVLLQTIIQFLPEASAPMSLLCFYVIVMVLFSGLLSIVNILILKVYMKPKDTKVPRFLFHFTELIQCTKFKRCFANCIKNKVASSETRKKEGKDLRVEEIEDLDMTAGKTNQKKADSQINRNVADVESTDKELDADEVDWYSVGKLLDFFFLLTFLGVQGAFSVFFLVPLGVRY